MREFINIVEGHTPIMEARMAPLYHYMYADKAISVFKSNTMPARWEHEIPHQGLVKGNSLTRNQNPELFGNRLVRLVFDQSKLAQTNKIIPLDGERVFRFTQSAMDEPDQRPHNVRLSARNNFNDRIINQRSNYQLAEEFVVGDIVPLHKYLQRIEIRSGNFYHMRGIDAVSLKDLVVEYCDKYGIELIINPDFLRQVEEIKRYWEEDE